MLIKNKNWISTHKVSQIIDSHYTHAHANIGGTIRTQAGQLEFLLLVQNYLSLKKLSKNVYNY